MDTKSNEGLVLLYYVKDIGEFDIVGGALFVNDSALLGECVVKKADDEADSKAY